MCACHNLCGNLFALFWFVAAVVEGGGVSGGVGESNSNNFVVYFGSSHTQKVLPVCCKTIRIHGRHRFWARNEKGFATARGGTKGRGGKGALNATLN